VLLNYHIGRFVLGLLCVGELVHQISNREQNDRCGNSTAKSQAPDDGHIIVRNMLST